MKIFLNKKVQNHIILQQEGITVAARWCLKGIFFLAIISLITDKYERHPDFNQYRLQLLASELSDTIIWLSAPSEHRNSH